jgi:predicted RNA methylase
MLQKYNKKHTNIREDKNKLNIFSKQLQKANRASFEDLGFGWGLMPQ